MLGREWKREGKRQTEGKYVETAWYVKDNTSMRDESLLAFAVQEQKIKPAHDLDK